MLTSAGSRGDGARCRELGIAAYLTKPIGQSELLQAVVQVLGAKHTEVVQSSLVTRHSIREQKPGLHILLAEDNRVNQPVVRGVLGKTRHRVEIANDGREVLEKIKRANFRSGFNGRADAGTRRIRNHSLHPANGKNERQSSSDHRGHGACSEG